MLSLKKNVTAVSGVVVVSLLFLASLTFFFATNDWFEEYSSNLKADLDKPELQNTLEISKLDGTNLYLKNDFGDNLTIRSIKVNEKECILSDVEIDKGLAVVDIGGCSVSNMQLQAKEIVLITDAGVYSEFEVLRNPIQGALIISYQMIPCDFSSGYRRLFGLNSLDNAHIDIDDVSTYNVCIRHLDYNLNLGSGGSTSQTLMYLIGTNNSAVWTNTSSVIISPPSWENLTISSSGGIFDYQVSSTQPSGDEHVCLGSIDLDNVYGSHFGDCDSSLPDKLWLKLD